MQAIRSFVKGDHSDTICSEIRTGLAEGIAHWGYNERLAIYRALDDPATGRHLKRLGISDDDLVQYIVARARGASPEVALDALLKSKNIERDDEAGFVRRIIESLPINNTQRKTG